MKPADYSPPQSPTIEQQRDALCKGLGRAYLWAASGKIEDELILEACVHDLRFDRQCEDRRGEWLWTLIEAAGAVDRLRAPILRELDELNNESAANQLCAIAGHYAERGDRSFHSLLYKIVAEKPDPDCPWWGEEEIIRLDGAPAFQLAVRVRGERLDVSDWDWDASALMDDAIERFGKDHVEALLASATDQGTRRFFDRWRQEVQRTEQQRQNPTRRDQMRAVSDVFSAASSDNRYFWLRYWGMHAAEGDLDEVLSYLQRESNPQITAKLLRVFSIRELPRFEPFLVELCRSADRDLRRAALLALSCNSHPLVRAFANNQLESGTCDGPLVRLFAKNFEPGDELRIFETITLPEDQNELHWLFMDVLKVLESNVEAECAKLGLSAYRLTPCENCRFYFARLLLGRNTAPDWLVRECVHDSHKDCRKLFSDVGA